ncbi:MAG: TPM domain-containing protein [Phycisphaerales bacterium]|nr:TPM domain-containing protein [Phycisphaerales bacterium]
MRLLLLPINYFRAILLFVACGLLLPLTNAQERYPGLQSAQLVMDQAHILSAPEQSALERKLVAFADTTSNQIAVIIIPSLNDKPIEELATALFRQYGIGTKKNNNGILLLVAIQEKKVRIEVGYGLEGAIPDLLAHDIIVKDIKPYFIKGFYYQGIDSATNDICRAALGEYRIKANKPNNNGTVVFLIMLGIVLLILFLMKRGGGRSGGGMGFGYFLPFMFLGGGRGGGGGNSDGGFDGFGGGSSGGGGASDGW